MKSEKVIRYFLDNCSYHSEVYRSLPQKSRLFYQYALFINCLLGILAIIQLWIHNRPVVYAILLIAIIILEFVLMGKRLKTLDLAENKYRKLHGDKQFDEISYNKLKQCLKHQNLFYQDRIESIKKQAEREITGLTINNIKFFAAAAVIFGAIFASFFQPLFIRFNSLSNIEHNLLALLFLMVVGFGICISVVPIQELSLMLRKKYTRHASLKRLSYLLEEMNLDDDL